MNTTAKNKPDQGFSLIELLIVVTVIGIVSAIAVPNLLKARQSANEASAVSTLRSIHSAQVTYRDGIGNGVYADLPTLNSSQLIDETVGVAPFTKGGYTFGVTAIAPSASLPARFDLISRPVTHVLDNTMGATGSKDFGATEQGAIYEKLDNTAVTFDAVTRLPTGGAVPLER